MFYCHLHKFLDCCIDIKLLVLLMSLFSPFIETYQLFITLFQSCSDSNNLTFNTPVNAKSELLQRIQNNEKKEKSKFLLNQEKREFSTLQLFRIIYHVFLSFLR